MEFLRSLWAKLSDKAEDYLGYEGFRFQLQRYALVTFLIILVLAGYIGSLAQQKNLASTLLDAALVNSTSSSLLVTQTDVELVPPIHEHSLIRDEVEDNTAPPLSTPAVAPTAEVDSRATYLADAPSAVSKTATLESTPTTESGLEADHKGGDKDKNGQKEVDGGDFADERQSPIEQGVKMVEKAESVDDNTTAAVDEGTDAGQREHKAASGAGEVKIPGADSQPEAEGALHANTTRGSDTPEEVTEDGSERVSETKRGSEGGGTGSRATDAGLDVKETSAVDILSDETSSKSSRQGTRSSKESSSEEDTEAGNQGEAHEGIVQLKGNQKGKQSDLSDDEVDISEDSRNRSEVNDSGGNLPDKKYPKSKKATKSAKNQREKKDEPQAVSENNYEGSKSEGLVKGERNREGAESEEGGDQAKDRSDSSQQEKLVKRKSENNDDYASLKSKVRSVGKKPKFTGAFKEKKKKTKGLKRKTSSDSDSIEEKVSEDPSPEEVEESLTSKRHATAKEKAKSNEQEAKKNAQDLEAEDGMEERGDTESLTGGGTKKELGNAQKGGREESEDDAHRSDADVSRDAGKGGPTSSNSEIPSRDAAKSDSRTDKGRNPAKALRKARNPKPKAKLLMKRPGKRPSTKKVRRQLLENAREHEVLSPALFCPDSRKDLHGRIEVAQDVGMQGPAVSPFTVHSILLLVSSFVTLGPMHDKSHISFISLIPRKAGLAGARAPRKLLVSGNEPGPLLSAAAVTSSAYKLPRKFLGMSALVRVGRRMKPRRLLVEGSPSVASGSIGYLQPIHYRSMAQGHRKILES